MSFSIDEIQSILVTEFVKGVSDIQRISMGVMNYNFRFRSQGKNYIIRASNRNNIEFEYKIIRQLFEGKCKVPRPVNILDTSRGKCMIYEELPGNALSESPVEKKYLRSLVKDILQNIRCISELKGDHFGNKAIEGQYSGNWYGFLNDVIEANRQNFVIHSEFSHNESTSIFKFLTSYKPEFNTNIPSLVWSDISRNNIIVNGNILSGFVDFEGCLFGDPLLCLGYLFALEGDSVLYQILADEFSRWIPFREETVLYYALFRIVRFAAYLDKPLPTGMKREPVKKYFKGIIPAISKIK